MGCSLVLEVRLIGVCDSLGRVVTAIELARTRNTAVVSPILRYLYI
jgi:hypothetical protein